MTNARFEDLEKRVKKIKLKRYSKILFVFIVLIGVLGYFFTQNLPIQNVNKQTLHVKKKEKPKKKKVQQFDAIKKEVKVKKSIEPANKNITYDTIKLKLNIPILDIENNKTINKKKEIIVKDFISKKNKINLQVKEVKSEEALLKRFKAAGDFESANSLAILYFKSEQYERSIFWSKKASKLNAQDESSWMIYAKSKNKLGKKEEAIKSLELYLDYFSSDKIRKLLNLYRSGK